MADITGNKQK